MSTLLQDLRYALRMLVKAPAFALVAIATLALGIGANTAIFSVVNALLLRPLPYPGADRLVVLWQDMRARGGPATEWATPGNFFDWKAETSIVERLAAVTGWGPSLSGVSEPEPLVGEQVSREYFEVLGVSPALGRSFAVNEDVPKAPRVAVLSHGLWQRRFGGDRSAVGRVVTLGGEPHEIIGVMPEGFRPAVIDAAEVWRPLRLNESTPSRGAVVLRVVGRLKAGVNLEQARAGMTALAKRLEQAYPASNSNAGINVVGLHDQVVGDIRLGLVVLLGAVAFVLLIACVNVANLLLARASGRSREVAVRMALGAARGRLVRQLLTESLLLATIGGIAGSLLGFWGVRTLVALAPAGAPRLDEIGLDSRVLVFTATITLLTGLLFGLAPALQTSGAGLTTTLKEGGRGIASRTGRRLRRVLIVAEVAIALMLLVGAGLLTRTFLRLQEVDLGFDHEQVIAGFVLPPPARYQSPEQRISFYDRLLEGAAALPGVEVAALSSILPLGGDSDSSFAIEGRPLPTTDAETPVAWYRLISPSYLDAMRIPLIRGRSFQPREPVPSIIINESMARKYWPGEDPLGRRISTGRERWFTIIGIVADVKMRGARAETQPEMYIPYWFQPEVGTNVVLKAAGNPALLAGPMRAMVRVIDPDLPVARLAPMSERVAGSIDQPRFFAVIAAIFAALALTLAAVGIYGVMSYSVAQRTQEIGVRMALGAGRREVFGLVVGDSLRLAGIGVAIGGVGALMVMRTIGALLFGVEPGDPMTFGLTAAGLLLVAGVAAFVPAHRATRVDPMTALRIE
jgi:putative ABC transport system permease protein